MDVSLVRSKRRAYQRADETEIAKVPNARWKKCMTASNAVFLDMQE